MSTIIVINIFALPLLQSRGGHSIVKLDTTCSQKNILLVSCMTKMGQNVINFFHE